MKKLNKFGYMVIYGGGVVISSLFVLLAVAEGSKGRVQAGYLWLELNAVSGLVSAITLLVFIYQSWSRIPPEIARTTPGKAIGYLFIPFLQLYWLFVVYLGWAKDWNKSMQGSGEGSKKMPEGLALSIAVMTLVNLVVGLIIYTIGQMTWVSVLFGMISGFLVLLYINMVCNLVNEHSVEDVEDEESEEKLPEENLAQRGSSRDVWSLVLGCVSIPSIFIPQFFGVLFGLPCAIIAIVLARRERRERKETLSLLGLIAGIIGVVLWAMMLITLAVMLI